jgi:hypothetical protein
VFAEIPVNEYVLLVAPEIFVQLPVVSVVDCHWNTIPPVDEKPVVDNVKDVDVPPDDTGLTVAVPAVGVPVQGFAPVPVKG